MGEKNRKGLMGGAWKITKKCLGKERTHGIPHIKELYRYFLFLKHLNPNNIRKDVVDALELAVILHDIGYRDTGIPDKKKLHSIKSIEILKKDFPSFRRKIPKKILRLMEFAIEKHQKPSGGKPDSAKKKCLFLLLLLDHMDQVGEKGIKRVRCYLKRVKGVVKILPEKEYLFDVRKWLKSPEPIPPERKDESLLEHLCSNYYYISGNKNKMRKIIPREFLKKYEKLGLYTKEYLLKISKRTCGK